MASDAPAARRQPRFNRAEWSWMFYDWANSAQTMIVAAVILPILFKTLTKSAGIATFTADAYWGYATSAATLLVALLAPLLGTLGDFRGYRMRLFTTFAGFGMVATAALGFVHNWQLMLVFYALSNFGFSASNIYYDGFLVDVTTNERMDRVSSTGYGLGYIGGSTIPFVAAIVLLLYGDKLGLSASASQAIVFVMTALWWAGFTIPLWRNVRQVNWVEPGPNPVVQSFRRLGQTFTHVRAHRALFLFLLAYFFYIDGVGTIIHMATVYGDSLGLTSMDLVLALLATQLIGFPCAIAYGRLAERFGTRRMIGVGIGTYFVICILGYFVNSFLTYLALAILVGTAQGGIQALSRSYFGRLIPDRKQANEYFGFFDIFGKFASFIGPALFGLVAQATGDSRFGVLSVLALFVLGGGMFLIAGRAEKETA